LTLQSASTYCQTSQPKVRNHRSQKFLQTCLKNKKKSIIIENKNAEIVEDMKKASQPQHDIVEEDTNSKEGLRFSIPIKNKAKTYKSKQVETPVTMKN
jgi:hypothetical protein